MPSPILDDDKSKKILLKEFFSEDTIGFIQLEIAIIGIMHVLVGFHDVHEFYEYIERGEMSRVATFFLLQTQYIGGFLLSGLSLLLGVFIVRTFFEGLDIKGESIIWGVFIISSVVMVICLTLILWNHLSYLITINIHPQFIILVCWTLPYSLGLIIWSIMFWGITLLIMPKKHNFL
ncbi:MULTISPECIES: hypothetical protein [unclassified Aureispira]|uniref:hypothetical protein n=1 Tax=unclassified Aureispira TaxID=2649989 RepID=UPI000697F765|nr:MULTISPECIES: hypothetical protein [unclassified Aureispira]WMX17369.1 hypothetical protein QP953_13390 [Aureispira sp. CCB-E]